MKEEKKERIKKGERKMYQPRCVPE
jgi:hypothetical protein